MREGDGRFPQSQIQVERRIQERRAELQMEAPPAELPLHKGRELPAAKRSLLAGTADCQQFSG